MGQCGGTAGAAEATIEDRLAENVDDDAIYLLADPAHAAASPATSGSGRPSVKATDVAYDLMVSRASTTSDGARPEGSTCRTGATC